MATAIVADTLTAVTLQHAAQLAVTGADVPRNLQTLTAKFEAINFAAAAVASSPPVAKTIGSSLAYAAAHPQEEAGEITIAFTNVVAVEDGDYFEVTLANFARSPEDAIPTATSAQLTVAPHFAVAECAWAHTTRVLTLTASDNFDAYTSKAFTLLAPAAITLPAESLAVNQPALTIRYVDEDAEANNIAAHGIAQSPARGLYATSLAFGATPVAATAAAVTVAFANTVDMVADDHVQVTLADFGGTNDPSFDSPPGQTLAGSTNFQPSTSSWTSVSDKRLQLVLNSPVTANNAQTVTVPAAVGITLPLAAIAPNQPTLQIAFVDTTSPPADDTSFAGMAAVLQAPAVASYGLLGTSLAYAPAVFGAVATITAKFTNPAAMAADDHIQLKLAGFTGGSKASPT